VLFPIGFDRVYLRCSHLHWWIVFTRLNL
jgi:hypothetical protein